MLGASRPLRRFLYPCFPGPSCFPVSALPLDRYLPSERYDESSLHEHPLNLEGEIPFFDLQSRHPATSHFLSECANPQKSSNCHGERFFRHLPQPTPYELARIRNSNVTVNMSPSASEPEPVEDPCRLSSYPKAGMRLRKIAQTDNARAQKLGPTRPAGAWIEPYLEALARSGLKMVAYTAAGVNASTVMRHRDQHPDFEKREEAAFRRALKDVVEPAIMKRAVQGVRRVRYGRDGKILQVEREVSDQLVLRLAERLERGTWVQKRQHEHSGQIVFKSRAERLAALEEAEKALGLPLRTAPASNRN
jgi:hypothetical protein